MATGMSSPDSDRPRYVIPDFFTNPVLRPYLSNVQRWQGYIRFLGLPDRRDNPDIVIDRLFVTPLLTRRYVSPDERPENWEGEAEALVDALAENTPLVLLGDPGSGKSTFLNYVAWLLSRLATNPLVERLGWHLPLPMVLREMPVRGVTDFDGLLDAFLSRELSAPLRQDDGRYLMQALAEGQAFLLLDGIDELGDRKTRENLRSAVFDGISQYPDCRWLLTSRIVGYDEVPFDTERNQPNEDRFPDELSASGAVHTALLRRDSRGLPQLGRESRGGQVAIRYLAPFDDRRIAVFAHNWYARREAAVARARANADHLVRAVHADGSILRLARVPNLLTMMALIHRIEATLPHGRALLYERIAEAYLESIDRFRGIETNPHDLPRKKVWLARVGFEMQRRRMSEDQPDGTNILMDAENVNGWLGEEMERSHAVPDTPSPEEFLKIIGRRSGLFLPRGEGLYAFVHLSFQEYFAAFALKREVTRLRWAKGNASRLGFDRDTLAGWAGQSVWRETLAFLFELLASEEDDDWHADLLDCVFGESLSRLEGSEAGDVSFNLGHLLARLVVNSRSGLTPQRRREAVRSCVKAEFQQPIQFWREGLSIFAVLLGDDTRLNDEVFYEIGVQIGQIQPDKRALDLSGAQISSFSQIKNITGLRVLNLRETPISDLSPLEDFNALNRLDLEDTRVVDLSPLTNLVALEWLDLDGTQVVDLSPLENLTALKRLYVSQTEVADLSPIVNLTALESLYLGATQVTDLSPLENLTALKRLNLSRTEVADLSPLVNLTALGHLHLDGTQVLSLSPLTNFTALERLDLEATGVSDLSPLASFAALDWLDLDGTKVVDLSPLKDLTALKRLFLSRTDVGDLSPLMNLTALESLHLSGTKVLDLSPLVNLTSLKTLTLSRTSVLDLSPIVNIASLKRLHLSGSKISAARIDELRKERSDLKIVY